MEMKLKSKTVLNMTEGNIAKVLIAFALPILISNLFQQLYNVVDIAVIGHVLGDDALAAVGATAAIYSLIIGFINGLSNGFCVVLARLYGGGKKDEFQTALRQTFFLSVIFVVVVTLGSTLGIDFILKMLNTPDEIYVLSKTYISIILLFCFVTFTYNLLSSQLRAIGNSTVPLYALVIASIVNVILDLLLVGVFEMGVSGAAIATVIAQAISGIFLIIYIKKSCLILHLDLKGFYIQKDILIELLTTGLSMAMMLVLTSIGTVVMQGSINRFGATTITGHTAARKIHDLCMLPYGTICTATATFVSQNYGAKKTKRIKSGIKCSLLLGSIWSMIVLSVILIGGKVLVQMLTGTEDVNVISVSMQYLYWNVPFYIMLNVLLIMRNSLQAIGSKTIPVFASILELVGKIAGVIWLVPLLEYLGICLIEPITWIVCIPVVVIGFITKIKDLEGNMVEA